MGLHVTTLTVDCRDLARLEALGARRADIGQGPDVDWVVMEDVEDNHFCVLRSLPMEDQR